MPDERAIARAVLRDWGRAVGTAGYPVDATLALRRGVLSEQDVLRPDGGDGTATLVRALVLELWPGALGALRADQSLTHDGRTYRLLWRAEGHGDAPLDRWAVAPA